MLESDNDQAKFALSREGEEVWLHHSQWGFVKLGPYDAVCAELCRFMEMTEFEERAGSAMSEQLTTVAC